MEYSTLQSKLILPAYGRNVQRMVEHCVSIADRSERQRCAESIVRTMARLHPELNNQEQQHTYYDHLALMSGFRLDIDYPFGAPQAETLRVHPTPLEYGNTLTKDRHYGSIVIRMIRRATEESDPARQKEICLRIASRLRYDYFIWNKEQASEEQIRRDIARLSDGKLNTDFPEFPTAFASPVSVQNGKRKKHKG